MRTKILFMWQRKQTLFLIIAFLLNFSLFFMEIASIQAGTLSYSFDILGLETLSDQGTTHFSTYLLIPLVAFSLLLTLLVILLYKRRQLQIKLAQLNLFIQLVLVAAIFYLAEEAIENIPWDGEATIKYVYGTYISLLPIIMIYAAIRFIKKDEALIRAADRIR